MHGDECCFANLTTLAMESFFNFFTKKRLPLVSLAKKWSWSASQKGRESMVFSKLRHVGYVTIMRAPHDSMMTTISKAAAQKDDVVVVIGRSVDCFSNFMLIDFDVCILPRSPHIGRFCLLRMLEYRVLDTNRSVERLTKLSKSFVIYHRKQRAPHSSIV